MTDPERLYSWREVRPLLGNIGRATAWRMVRDGRLPAPMRISPGRVAWRHSDIAAWQRGEWPHAPGN